MRLAPRLLIFMLSVLAIGLSSAPRDIHAQGTTCCVLSDNGGGTADHPPSCPNGYVGHMEIVDGLPSGTTVQIPANLGSPGGFLSLVQTPGGALGGMSESWQSTIQMQLSGTGLLSAYTRALVMPLSTGITHSAPRTPSSTPQSFNTDLYIMQGQLPPGDPDFDLLRVTAGTGFGLPSPGHTIFTSVAGGWAVDSFFDITYRIDFIGAPGSPFAGMSGSTTRTYRFEMCHSDVVDARVGTWGALKLLYR